MVIPNDVWDEIRGRLIVVLQKQQDMLNALADFSRTHPELDMSALALKTLDFPEAAESLTVLVSIITDENMPQEARPS